MTTPYQPPFDPTFVVCSELTKQGFSIEEIKFATSNPPQVRPVFAVKGGERHLFRIVIEPPGFTTEEGKHLFEYEGRERQQLLASIPPENVHYVFVSESSGDYPTIDWRGLF